MDEKVKEQILAIRDTGLTNMFDLPVVQRLAYERDFYELVNMIRINLLYPARRVINTLPKGNHTYGGTKP